ncbi:MAG: hypothetical protein WBN04_12580 [Paracoccaceae bacterium]
MGRGRKLGTAGIVIATAVIGSGAGLAQVTDSNSSPVVKLNLTTSLTADTNKDLDPVSLGTTVTAAEIVSLSILSETRNQVLSFSAEGALQVADEPGGGTSSGFADPSVRLAYARDAANSSVSLSANYRDTDVNRSTIDDDLIPEDLIVDPGTLKTYGADAQFRYGIDAPLGVTISASTNIRDYSNTIDPDLVDSTRDRFGVSASLRFSPVTSATLSTDLDRLDEDGPDNLQRDKTSYSVSLSHELRRALTVTGELGYSQTETTEFGTRTDEDSVFGSLDLRQALPDGAIFGGVSFENRSADPNRVSLKFGREMELRNGALAGSLTLTQTDGSDLKLLGALDYNRELPRGALTLVLSQSITSNSDNNDVEISKLAVGYLHNINSLSRFNLAMDVSRTNEAGNGNVDKRTRANFTASYSRDLTADWDLNLGYKRREYRETGSGDANSDSVFLTLSRGISLGF